MKRRNVRTLSLIVVTFTYLLVGAAVFDALEGKHNEDAQKALNNMKKNFKLKYNMSEDEYKIIEVSVRPRQWRYTIFKIFLSAPPSSTFFSYTVDHQYFRHKIIDPLPYYGRDFKQRSQRKCNGAFAPPKPNLLSTR